MESRFKHCEFQLGPKAEKLTGQEKAVVLFLALGLNNRQIAERMSRSPSTTKRLIDELFAAFEVNTRGAVVAQSFCHGVLIPSAQAEAV